jgi:hypothetical protein
MSSDGVQRLTSKLSRWHGLATAVSVALLSGAFIVALDAALTLGTGSRTLLSILWLGLVSLLVYRGITTRPKASSLSTLLQLFMVSLLLVIALFVVCFASGSAEKLRRFILPWQLSPADRPFKLIVPSGDCVIPTGESVTLVGYLEAGRDWRLPDTMDLIVRKSGEAEQSFVMNREPGGTYWLTRSAIDEPFEYCLKAGSERSSWYRVAVAEPVFLKETTQATLTPPVYAAGQVQQREQKTWGTIEALAFSRLLLTFRFTRPVTNVQLDWTPIDGSTQQVSVKLDPDRTAGVATLELQQSGMLHLQLFGERNLRTESSAMVRVAADQPPTFEKVAGISTSTLEARPDDRVLIDLAARDDLQIAKAWIEFLVGATEEQIQAVPIRLPGLGTSRVEGTVLFPLLGKVKEGDTIKFRLVLADNRQLLSKSFGPQEARYPGTGWSTLRIRSNVLPLAEQEIYGQQQRLKTTIKTIQTELENLSLNLREFRSEKLGDGSLSLDQSLRVRGFVDSLNKTAKQLEELGKELHLTPDLQGLARATTDISVAVRSTIQYLQRSEAEPKSTQRDVALNKAQEGVTGLQKSITTLAELSEKTASIRLASRGLRELASDQRDLAELASRPDARPEEIAQQQRELSARLSQLINRNTILAKLVQDASQEEIRQGLNRIGSWLDSQQLLQAARQATDRAYRQQQLKNLQHEQLTLLELATLLAERTATAARVAGAAPMNITPFEKSRELLVNGQAVQALAEQEKAIRELDRLSQTHRSGVAIRVELREAIRQLARWQDDLRRRCSDNPVSLRSSFAAEQKQLSAALESIAIQDADAAFLKAFQAAHNDLKTATDELNAKPESSPNALKIAAESLNKLTGLTPSLTDRLKAAKPKVDQLRRDFDTIRTDVERIILTRDQDPGLEQLKGVSDKLTTWVQKLRRLDVPSLEPRRIVVVALTGLAIEDVQRGYIEDVPASLLQVRKQLDNLRQALDGQPLTEEQLRELTGSHQKLDQRLKSIVRLSPTESAELELDQRDRARALSRIADAEAPIAFAELRSLNDGFETALRKGEPLDALRQRSQIMLQKLRTLSARLAGEESEQERLNRLVQERQTELAASKLTPGRGPAASQESARRADQQLEELNQTRVGVASSAKRKAVEALNQLRSANMPDRRPTLQQAALESMEKLRDELAKQPQRSIPWRQNLRFEQSERQKLEELSANGKLPNLATAQLVEDLAKQQQLTRDATALAIESINRGIEPAAKDELVELAKRLDSPSSKRIANSLRNGAMPDPQALAGLAIEQLSEIRQQGSRLDLQTTRQNYRQQELLKELLDIILDIRRSAIHRGGTFNESLLQLAELLESIREKLTQSQRERTAKRSQQAATLLQEAQQLGQTTRMMLETQLKALPKPGETEPASLTGFALLTALDAMQDVSQRLNQKQGLRPAAETMQTAAEALSRAAGRMKP